MSERMTDKERSKIEEFVEAGHALSEDQASALLVETDRARASEEQKDAVIKALADALWRNAPHWFDGATGERTFQSPEVTEALRLAGRLP